MLHQELAFDGDVASPEIIIRHLPETSESVHVKVVPVAQEHRVIEDAGLVDAAEHRHLLFRVSRMHRQVVLQRLRCHHNVIGHQQHEWRPRHLEPAVLRISGPMVAVMEVSQLERRPLLPR